MSDHEHQYTSVVVIQWREGHDWDEYERKESMSANNYAEAVLLVCPCGETKRVDL